MDRFEEFLKELGRQIDVPLHPDTRRICRINVNQALHVQLEYDEGKERVLFATFLCDIPPGKFREEVFKEALKANGVFPRAGTLGFSDRNNKMALFDSLSIHERVGEKTTAFLFSFIETARQWKEAIEGGRTAPPPKMK